MADHHWTKNDSDLWAVRCEVKKETFLPNHPAWVNEGKCPFCGANALFEIENRKKEREQKDREARLEEAKTQNLKNKNTLTGYM